ncbi:MAG: flavin-containing monooxygenase [Pseudonocardia sp.]
MDATRPADRDADRPHVDRHVDRHVEVLIVGAGVSGIGAACRLTRERPGTAYAILEQRAALGGTWDLFRYPGVRSDTDMFTYSYPFLPWDGTQAMGDGADIRAYLQQAAREHDVERHIVFGTTALGASWSSADARWTVRTDSDTDTWTCAFLLVCTGYYDYARGHEPELPGREEFAGTVVHPQFWPADLQLRDRRVVVIGSGATAVTIVPAIAREAAHVTMLQRSPSYVLPLPAVDALADALRARLPRRLAHRLVRVKNVLLTQGTYTFFRTFPATSRRLLRGMAVRLVGDEAYVDAHFTPRYDPWHQRLTIAPDGDMFTAIREGRAGVVTDTVDRLVPEGIRLASGTTLPADVVVCATGLVLRPLGGLELTVDGRAVSLPDTVAYRAVMLSGVPNLAFSFGYTNTSWTLRSDLSARFVCRLLRHMDRHGQAVATPAPATGLVRRPFIDDLEAGYIRRGIGAFPRKGGRAPWLVRQNYLVDRLAALPGDVTREMRFTPRARDRVAARR